MTHEVREALTHVVDPELGMNVVELGLVYGIEVEDGDVHVRMTMTTPTCPLGESMSAEAAAAIRERVRGARSVQVDLVWDPAWDPSRMSEAARERLGWA